MFHDSVSVTVAPLSLDRWYVRLLPRGSNVEHFVLNFHSRSASPLPVPVFTGRQNGTVTV